jgi:hypothetical protein
MGNFNSRIAHLHIYQYPAGLLDIIQSYFEFHLQKKESILLESDYVELCPKTFQQCIQGFRFCTSWPDYQFLANSIYKDKKDFFLKVWSWIGFMEHIIIIFNRSYQLRKLIFGLKIHSSAWKNYPKNNVVIKLIMGNFNSRIAHLHIYQYPEGLLDIIQSYFDTNQNKFYNKIIVSVGCGRAQMEMHSSNLHICLNINKHALLCAKFVMKYLFRKKSNLILQHYNIKEGLIQLSTTIHTKIPSVDLVVIFQHPSLSIDPVVRDALIGRTMWCMSMCMIDIVSNVHFIYDWHSNRNCWNINELKSLVIQESNSSHLLALTYTEDIKISIDDTLLADHPIIGIASCRGGALMKKGHERSFSVYNKNI